jgi:O-methyltransferase involved in polyketide biosynthesis
VAEHDDWDIVSGAGITALAVAAMRAMESKRDDALINDPYAENFVRRSGTTVPMPTSWTDIDDSGCSARTSTRSALPPGWAEGLLLYLPGAATEALFTHVHRLSAPSSWFATDEAGPDVRSRIHDPVHQEVRRRLGLDIAALWPDDDRPSPGRWFRDHDWQVTAISRIQAADRYGRPLGESAGDIAKGTLLTARLT